MRHTQPFSLAHLERIIDEVLSQDTEAGVNGWNELCHAHPSDIAHLVENISGDQKTLLFIKLPVDLATETFQWLEVLVQVDVLGSLSDTQAAHIFKHMHADDLADLLEHLEDEQVQHYLKLLQKNQRAQIMSLLTFDSESAGGIMNSDVFTLTKDFTVKHSVGLLQRLSPRKELCERIYVTDSENILVGHISLDQLVLNKPDTLIKNILKKNELLIHASQDQEEAVQQMTHYELLSAPVIDDHQHFLGVITGEEAFTVLQEEASEDVYMMSGVGNVEHSYFETPFLTMFYERSKWLIGLLLFQSVSSLIMKRFDTLLTEHVIISLFLTMLIGTGGNAGNQSATLVIRGLATGEISRTKRFQLILREFSFGIAMAALLSIVSFGRVWLMHSNFIAALTISVSLFCIVITSMLLGTLIPLSLNRLGIDPAHSAAPFLSTLMDIIGIIIYCTICSWLLT